MQVHPNLENVDLMDNIDIGDVGVTSLAEGVAVSRSLKR